MVFLDITYLPSMPAWVDRVSSLHDTSMSLLHTFSWEAKSPGNALELKQGFQGNHSSNDKQTPASINQHNMHLDSSQQQASDFE